MSSFGKILSILDLFSLERPVWTVEQIAQEQDFSVPSAYRYVRDLVDSGLLQKVSAGDYSLGPRAAMMDYTVKSSDPLLMASIPIMKSLVAKLECRCVLTRMAGRYCLDVHHEGLPNEIQLTFDRGRPRPLFYGAAPKVILSHATPARLRKLYGEQADAIQQARVADSEAEFLEQMRTIRQQGFYLSRGELEPEIAALAVPVVLSSKQDVAALAMVASTARFELTDLDKLRALVTEAALQISSRFDA